MHVRNPYTQAPWRWWFLPNGCTMTMCVCECMCVCVHMACGHPAMLACYSIVSEPLYLSKWNFLPSAAWNWQNSFSKWRVSAERCTRAHSSIPGVHVLTALSGMGRQKDIPMLEKPPCMTQWKAGCRWQTPVTAGSHLLSAQHLQVYPLKGKRQGWILLSWGRTAMPSQPWWDTH